MTDFTTLPDNLPVPRDDGAADHLTGLPMPGLSVQASDRQSVDLAATGPGRTIIYIYPLTGRPGVDLPEGWDAIPGARGCSTEACDFRDHFADLQAAGVTQVWGELTGRLPRQSRSPATAAGSPLNSPTPEYLRSRMVTCRCEWSARRTAVRCGYGASLLAVEARK